jgi:hypothetical protein
MVHLRQGIGKVDVTELKAMFETAAEVLGRLKKAFSTNPQLPARRFEQLDGIAGRIVE